jgi:hypothetical protein
MSWIFITLFTRARHCCLPESRAQVCPICMLTISQMCHGADINGRIDICTLHNISHIFHVLSRAQHLIVMDTCLPSINFACCNNVMYTVIKTLFIVWSSRRNNQLRSIIYNNQSTPFDVYCNVWLWILTAVTSLRFILSGYRQSTIEGMWTILYIGI